MKYNFLFHFDIFDVKPALSGHSKINKTKNLKANGSLMKAKGMAECSLVAFCNTFDLHYAIIGLETNFGILFEWPLQAGFIVCGIQFESTIYTRNRVTLC